MKAILILDEMPTSCEMCYLCRMREKGRFCVITKEYDREVGRVQKNCPLITEEQYIKNIYHVLYDMVVRDVLAQRELAKKVYVFKVGEDE